MPRNGPRPGDALRKLTDDMRQDILSANPGIVTEIARLAGCSTSTASKTFRIKTGRLNVRAARMWEARLTELIARTMPEGCKQ